MKAERRETSHGFVGREVFNASTLKSEAAVAKGPGKLETPALARHTST